MFKNQKSAAYCEELHDMYMNRSRNLIEQVLRLDSKNEKALMRKCNVMLALGEDFSSILPDLDEVAFQSDKSQAVYGEITFLRSAITELEKNR